MLPYDELEIQINSRESFPLLRDEVVTGKIFAVQLFNSELLVNGPDGCLVLTRFKLDGQHEVVCKGI